MLLFLTASFDVASTAGIAEVVEELQEEEEMGGEGSFNIEPTPKEDGDKALEGGTEVAAAEPKELLFGLLNI